MEIGLPTISKKKKGGFFTSFHFFISLSLLLVVWVFLYGCAPKPIKGYESNTAVRREIVQQAFGLLGKPYQDGAKGPEAFDCSGFIYHIFLKIGMTLPPMTEGLMRQGAIVSGERVQAGDLVFFKIAKDLHVGIMINKREFIHASGSRGIVMDDLSGSYWRRSLIGFRSVL